MSHRTISHRNGHPALPSPRHTHYLWFALFVLGVLALSGTFSPAQAKGGAHPVSEPTVELAYISVLGHEQNARAWYKNSASTGVPIQDALDHFAKQGFVIVRTTDALRQTASLDGIAFAIVLQKVR